MKLKTALKPVVRFLTTEPPFRLAAKLGAKFFPVSLDAKSKWDAVDRPQYLFGLLAAARQARDENCSSVSVIEFGVAEGYGLLALQRHAASVMRDTGIAFKVYGFDSGSGLPLGTGDYRDHPDVWKPGDYKMDASPLQKRLAAYTELVLGPISQTAAEHPLTGPVGFISMDLDFYSSTSDALKILTRADVHLLRRVVIYFDDIQGRYVHRFAGELLAINEFNSGNPNVKIDQWHGVECGRPFPEAEWLKGMYLAHDLAAISQVKLRRPDATMR